LSPSGIALLVGGVFTVVTTVLVAWLAVGRIRRAVGEATAAFERLNPAMERFQRDGEVTRREVERVGDALDELTTARAMRRSRRSEDPERSAFAGVDSDVTAESPLADDREDPR
jgi:uncharacterized membrane protein YccC